MSVRLKITLLFTLVVVIIWGLVCGGIYYFSYAARVETIKTRLSNRAITTARLLEQSETFDQALLRKIDSSTTLALKRKSVQAYENEIPVYYYSEVPGDTVKTDAALLQETAEEGKKYFTADGRDVIAYRYLSDREDIVVICAADDKDGKLNLHRLKNILLACFFGGTLISFGGGYFFSRQLLRPVKRIAHEVKDISVYSLDRRIKQNESTDEWNYLVTTLNELLDRLKESFEVQRRFISNASHELSTPLTIISSQLEITLQRDRKDEEYRQALQVALQDVKHMSHLVQILLKFATASGDAGGLNIDLVRIDEILMRLPGDLRKKDKANVVNLVFNELPEDHNSLLVLGNEELLFTALNNIVSNACKYADDNVANVTLTLSGSFFIIEIADQGIGIDEKEIENIFQPFYRAGETAFKEGFGLGLSLAHRIIKLHKGSISVKSAVNSGSTFTIIIPAAN